MRKIALTIVLILCMTMCSQIAVGNPRLFEEREGQLFEEDTILSMERIDPSEIPLNSFGTRASDDEASQWDDDYLNGSLISSTPETITGTLNHTGTPSTPTYEDEKDWYKIKVDNVNPSVPGMIPEFTITLNSFEASSSSEDDLYELRLVDDGEDGLKMEDDYADMIKMEILHVDYWNGLTRKGGWDFHYDDGDDTDSWTHDSNWSFSWKADLNSEGTQDTNGAGFGVSELNWYYIGISYFRIKEIPFTTYDYEIEYDFTISAPTNRADNVYPNDWKNATSLGDEKRGNLSSLGDHEDWFEIVGSDYDKVWNISYNWNRSKFSNEMLHNFWYAEWFTTNYYADMWMHFYLIYSTWGPDMTWGTSDDSWSSRKMILTAMLDQEGFCTTDRSWSGFFINDMVGGSSSTRKVYMGVILEVVEYKVSQGNIYGFRPSTFEVSFDYLISVSTTTFTPNNPPSLSNVNIVSTNPQYASSGNLDDNYTLSFTYTDEDNDPPDQILLAMDDEPGVSDTDLASYEFEVNVSDTDYTDGKDYVVNFTGMEIGTSPISHTVRMIASDNLTSDPDRTSNWSDPVVLEDHFSVWNDSVPGLNPAFTGFAPVDEDSPSILQPMDNDIDGIFMDEEGFTLFQIWNASLGDWDDALDTSLLHVEFTIIGGDWFANITPKQNQHGTEDIWFRGVDLHMTVEGKFPFTINSVIDPPLVLNIEVDGYEYEVDSSNPYRPVAHLEDLVVLEDSEFSFEISAINPEVGTLEFSYYHHTSDPWDTYIVVDNSTGSVNFTPTNNDVGAKNSKMVFQISGDTEGPKAFLEVYFNITNVNDPPEITISSTMLRTYMQFRKITIKPLIIDVDPDDVLTVGTNMVNILYGVENTALEQIPYARLGKGVDWDIDPETGNFWFQLDDQEIWRTEDGMVQQVEVLLTFMVTDLAGANDTASINLIIINENEEPEQPVEIFYQQIGLTVNFWVDPVSDPDEDLLRYRWDFGDGQTGEGINVNHTYVKEGPKNIQMWVEDDDFQTERIAVQVWVDEFAGDRDQDGVADQDDAFPDNRHEWIDSDFDGVGDNGDAFPDDPSETKDSDMDGVGDNTDAFPTDPAASIDTDGDGYPDEWNNGLSEDDSTTGLKLDLFPEDETRSGQSEPKDHSEPGDNTFIILIVLAIIAMLVFIVIAGGVVVVLMTRSREENEE